MHWQVIDGHQYVATSAVRRVATTQSVATGDGGQLHDTDVLVTACGRICVHRNRVNISHVLAGQRVGTKEVDEGIWIVSFMHYDLGYIDLEQQTLQPLDNPFGPRLSPMS